MKDYYITNNKNLAQKKLKELFTKVVISDVRMEDKGYRIEWITAKEFYKNSVEAQQDMDKYLDFLLNKFEPEAKKKEILIDEQEEKLSPKKKKDREVSSIMDAISK